MNKNLQDMKLKDADKKPQNDFIVTFKFSF